MSSTNALRAGDRGRDLEGSGVASSEVAVWRGSKYSPGLPRASGKCTVSDMLPVAWLDAKRESGDGASLKGWTRVAARVVCCSTLYSRGDTRALVVIERERRALDASQSVGIGAAGLLMHRSCHHDSYIL